MPGWDHDDLISKHWPSPRSTTHAKNGKDDMPRDKRPDDPVTSTPPAPAVKKTRAQVGLERHLDRASKTLSKLEEELVACVSLRALYLEVRAALDDVRDAHFFAAAFVEENKP